MSSLKDLASLIMIPSLVKDGRLDTVKPLGNEIIHPDATGNNDGTDGSTPSEGNFTFSRGSNLAATRVDVNGLIEKGRENLLLQSNQFDTTWAKSSATIASGQSGYDGSNNAWNFTTSAAGASLEQSVTTTGVVVFSLYAKANGINGVRLRIDAATDANGYFNLSTGAVHSFAGSAINASITSVGGGWYRCEVAANISSPVKVAIYTTDGTTSYDNGSILIQDSQLEQGLVATDYIETGASTAQSGVLEDLPRLDYSGGASCPALLLEPQRSNLFDYSEYFGSTSWVKSNSSVTTNTAVSPSGNTNANLITSSGSEGQIYQTKTLNGSHTLSAFFKAGTSVLARLQFYDSGAGTSAVGIYNLTTKSISASGLSSTGTITDYGNGWYRCTLTASLSGSAVLCFLGLNENAKNILSWGAQLEAGSYPTSYIPTYGSAVTRSNDSCAATSVSDVIGQSEGTAYIEFEIDNLSESGNEKVLFYMKDNGTGERYLSFVNNGSLTYIESNGAVIANISKTGLSVGSYKAAIAYKTNDFAFYLNGEQVGTDNAGTPSGFSTFGFQYYNAAVSGTQFAKQAVLFKTRLTNAELAALTA